MVVQHNMQAMNANRMLNVTTSTQAKSTEKLSSGYKINRAADDAAGLTISEKMRKQIKGLDQASTNAEDGVSAVQTAEGALTEVHSMLQRMNELAVQASNGTNSESDRSAIQDEISQLTTEIDRVSETTKFNETYLLKGNVDGTSSKVNVNAHDAGLDGKLVDSADGKTSTFTLDKKLENGSKITIGGTEYTIGETKSKDNYALTADAGNLVLKAGDSITSGGVKKTLTDDVAVVTNAKFGDTAFAAGDTITTNDGTVYTYHAAGAQNTAVGFYKDGDWADTTAAAGKVVNATTIAVEGSTIYDDSASASHKVVGALADGEVSTAAYANLKASTVNGAALAAGDSVTASGKTTSVVAAGFTPTNFDEVKKGIQGSAAGNTVIIASQKGTGSKTYTIVENSDEEDVAANKLTRESIIDKIKEGNQVTYAKGTANTSTTVTAAGVDAVEENTITVDEAYKKIASELESASSIGTDTAAKVANKGDGSFEITKGTVEVKDALSFSLHVGADADMTNKINVDIESMSAAGLGIKGINVKDDSGKAATYAIDAIADAVSKVSAQRSALGAVQNRLEHTIANVDNVVENTTSAESRIRDTDMAEEMVEYSKNNILAQAGQSMLAQANQSNQGVLSLLQ